MPDRVGVGGRGAAGLGGVDVLGPLWAAWRGAVAFSRGLSWRRRRIVVRWERSLVCLLLVVGAAGSAWAEPFRLWLSGTVLAGRGRMAGQVVVRPPVGAGAVRCASVKLVPAGPAGGLTGLLIALGPESPDVVVPDVDHAGRWRSADVAPGWRYAVVVEAEGCGPQVAGVADTFWLRAVRVDNYMASCQSADRAPPVF